MNEFELKAATALKNGGVDVIDCSIESSDNPYLNGNGNRSDVLIFTILCPCGSEFREAMLLSALWESTFDKTCKFLAERMHQHLVDDGLIVGAK